MKTIMRKTGIILFFLLTSFFSCQKNDTTIFEGYFRNKITNEPIRGASISIETSGGGGMNIIYKSSKKKSKEVLCAGLSSSSSIDEISTTTDENGYFQVKASLGVLFLRCHLTRENGTASYELHAFKQNAKNTVNLLADCSVKFLPSIAPKGTISSKDSVFL